MRRAAKLSFLSPPERLALVGACLLLLLQTMPAVLSALEYQRALLLSQPWRLLSAHLVHINWMHAGINALTWVILARLFAPDLSTARQLQTLSASALLVSAGLALLYPQIGWYRGASAALHALFFAGAMTWFTSKLWRPEQRSPAALWLPALLLLGGLVKIAMEHPRGDTLPFADWLGAPTAPQAHSLGAGVGVLLGLYFANRDRRRV